MLLQNWALVTQEETASPLNYNPSYPHRKKMKNYASSKKLLTPIKEKGPLGKKSPLTRKKESNQ